jgi:hypothetical protein
VLRRPGEEPPRTQQVVAYRQGPVAEGLARGVGWSQAGDAGVQEFQALEQARVVITPRPVAGEGRREGLAQEGPERGRLGPVELQLPVEPHEVRTGGPIITGGDGRYIVDGHHRWSSIYVINPDAAIEAVDLGHEVAPQNYLKVTQMAIGAELGYLQVQTVEGQNLFTIGHDDFDAWVKATITGGKDPQGVLDVFQRLRGLNGLQAVADFLWGNVESLRAFNLPLPGVTSRDYMPQPPSDGLASLLIWFESGQLNSRFPVVARLG